MKKLPKLLQKHCVLVYQVIDNKLVVVKTSIFDTHYSCIKFANALIKCGYYAEAKTKVFIEPIK